MKVPWKKSGGIVPQPKPEGPAFALWGIAYRKVGGSELHFLRVDGEYEHVGFKVPKGTVRALAMDGRAVRIIMDGPLIIERTDLEVVHKLWSKPPHAQPPKEGGDA
jgi:hypothetical protein